MDYRSRYTQLTAEQQQVYREMQQQPRSTPVRLYLESKYQAICIEARALERLLRMQQSATKRRAG